jgi:hypothetical protein
MAFKPAVKHGARLRFAISGPAGSGKTFTLLRLATELTNHGKIAFVDTEHGSASKYAHTSACTADCKDPSHFVFDVDEPASFSPSKLTETIMEAVKAGYDAICIDSLSHYWMGPDGELEMVDSAAERSKSKNSFTAWKSVTPIHNKLVDTMIAAPIHVLVSMRSKTEWVIDEDKNGKKVPRKIGLTPVMRDGIEYEFDVCGDMDQENRLTVSKSRCSGMASKIFHQPGLEVAEILKAWLGTPAAQVARGDGPAAVPSVAEGAAESPGSHRASPAAASTPAEDVPVPLRALFEGLHKPGYIKQGFEMMKARLLELAPVMGATAYREIQKRHGITTSSTIAEYKACLLDMWQQCETWQAEVEAEHHAALGITDDDVPKAAAAAAPAPHQETLIPEVVK